METKKAKVSLAQFKSDYEGKYGMMYYHTIEFDNGDKGQYCSKSKEQNKFVVDKEADYTIEKTEKNGYTNYTIKPYTENTFQGGGGKKQSNNASFALSYSKDLVIAGKVSIEQILETANKLNNWLNSN